MSEKQVEISRFTYYYENIEVNKIDSSQLCPEFEPMGEINECLNCETITKLLPFSKNFFDIWKNQFKSLSSVQTKNGKTNNHSTTLYHSFGSIKDKVLIFETKINLPLSQINRAIEEIKKEDQKDIYSAIIKKTIRNWKGDYSPDGDYFYFINLPLDSFPSETNTPKDVDLEIIKEVKSKLTINGKCIFTNLGFEDKSFPDDSFYNKDILQIVANEQQPLIVISPAKDQSRLIIFDEKLFVRCYYSESEKENAKKTLPIRLVITTVLCQRAFLEYASKASINIANNKIRSETYTELTKQFADFVDHFWRLDISNSLFLNKSYRIIGKIWLLNQKFDITKQHLLRNADIEENKKQKQITYALIIIGLVTITSAINDGFAFFENITS
jgi:hypothetical protein